MLKLCFGDSHYSDCILIILDDNESELSSNRCRDEHYFLCPLLPVVSSVTSTNCPSTVDSALGPASDVHHIDSLPSVEFAMVPANEANEKALDSIMGILIEEYNETMLRMSKDKTVTYNQITCSDHPYGFTVSKVLPEDIELLVGIHEDDLSDASDDDAESLSPCLEPGNDDDYCEVHSYANHVRLFKKQHSKPVAHHDIVPGAVVYDGVMWPFHSRGIDCNVTRALSTLYGDAKKGFGDRRVTKIRGVWGYFGSRATSQASCTNEYANSKGHNLYRATYNDMVYLCFNRVTNELCNESESVSFMLGDTITRLALDFCAGMEDGTAVFKVRPSCFCVNM
jgi:hypothetical protein